MEKIKEEQTEVVKYVHLYGSLHEAGNLIGTDLDRFLLSSFFAQRRMYISLKSVRQGRNRDTQPLF